MNNFLKTIICMISISIVMYYTEIVGLISFDLYFFYSLILLLQIGLSLKTLYRGNL